MTEKSDQHSVFHRTILRAFKSGERQKNVVADIPIKYGKAPKYNFIKSDALRDLKIVSREELIRALEKCPARMKLKLI